MIANNDFSGASYAGIIANGYGLAYGALVASNVLNQGLNYHTQFQTSNSFTSFFYNNQYVSGTNKVPVAPFMDPATTAAHISN
jgi:hypothetical protein